MSAPSNTIATLFTADLAGLQKKSAILAAIGIAGLLAGSMVNRPQFFISYLPAFIFWGGLALGFLVLHLLHNSTGGKWGRPLRAYLEAGSRTVPFMLPFFIPILLGMHQLYSWTRPEAQAHIEGWETKKHYLSVGFFTARAIFYFIVWVLYSVLLKKWNTDNARRGLEEHGKLQTFSCVGLIVFFLVGSFAAIDWIMSLEPDWFSSIFGVITIVGQGLTAFLFMVVFTYLVVGKAKAESVIPVEQLHDLGKLIMMGVMLWTYTSFSQFLIIWSAQLPEETSWYLHRAAGPWFCVSIALIGLHFFIPWFLLLFRRTKRVFRNLALVAGFVFVVHMLYDIWLVAPAFRNTGPVIHWLDLVAFFALGAAFVTLFVSQLRAIGSAPFEDKISPNLGRHDVGHSAPQDKPTGLKPRPA